MQRSQHILKFNGRVVKAVRVIPSKQLGSYFETEDYFTGTTQKVSDLCADKLQIIPVRLEQ